MDEKTKQQIEQAAERLAKAVESPVDTDASEDFETIFKSMGKEAVKEFVRTLSDDELVVMEGIISKAISMDAKAVKQPKNIKQDESEELSPTAQTSKENEELMITQAAAHNHQGDNSPEGFEGQVIKGLQLPEGMSVEEANEILAKAKSNVPLAGKEASAKKKAPMAGDSKDGLKGSEAEEPKAEGAKMQKSDEAVKAEEAPAEEIEKAKLPKAPLNAASPAEAKGKKSKDQKPMSGDPEENASPSKEPKAEGAKMQKSVKWGIPTHVKLSLAGTRGQNAHYDVADEIIKSEQSRQRSEDLAKSGARWFSEPEQVKKSTAGEETSPEAPQAPGINDIIEQGFDKSQDDIKRALAKSAPIGKAAPLTFEEQEIAKALNLTQEQTESILGKPAKE